MSGVLIIGAQQKGLIGDLIAKAEEIGPLNAQQVIDTMKTPEGEKAHRDLMDTLTIHLPIDYQVTFSFEEQPGGEVYRHISVSVKKAGRMPRLEALDVIAEEFGFRVPLNSAKHIWTEPLNDGRAALNALQRKDPSP